MIIAIISGVALIGLVLWDVFEVIVLPRRVQRSARPARYFIRSLWRLWSMTAGRVRNSARRENLLSIFGPLFLLMLIISWAAVLVLAYALLYWGIGDLNSIRAGDTGFTTDLYFSGTAFFTLGLGDVSPHGGMARLIAVLEAANGFGFLALVIGYLPTFYQSFSRRETNIALLDARAGSPPTAGELLRRCSSDRASDAMGRLLADSERWAAELLESHLSYPVLMLFRSQHERQSWVAALTAILDASAVIMTVETGANAQQARLTFAMARHAAVDLSDVFERSPGMPQQDRLPPEDLARLKAIVSAKSGPSQTDAWHTELSALRATYEPYVTALSRYLMMPLPPWIPAEDAVDDWQTSRL